MDTYNYLKIKLPFLLPESRRLMGKNAKSVQIPLSKKTASEIIYEKGGGEPGEFLRESAKSVIRYELSVISQLDSFVPSDLL